MKKLIFCFLIVAGCDDFAAVINDFSNLNQTTVNRILYPKNYKQIKQILLKAKQKNLKVSMAGKRHSQGGHAFYNNAVVIDIRRLNKIVNLDLDKKIIRVQTGVTWQQIQEYINPHGLAVKVMQYTNIFTIGGALSVNANGMDPRYGSLIETVKSFKIMLHDGKILTCSREKNSELFKLAIGGLGLFGFILQAEIELTDNCIYQKNTKLMDIKEYPEHISKFVGNKDMCITPASGTSCFHYAQVLVNPLSARPAPQKVFNKIIVFDFNKTNTKNKRAFKLKKNSSTIFYNSFNLNLVRESKTIKQVNNVFKVIQGKLDFNISRNNLMRPPIDFLYRKSPKDTDLLQEYFVPVNKFNEFINFFEKLIKQESINIIELALRYIRKNNEAFMSYANTDVIGVVFLFNQKISADHIDKTNNWSQKLIKKAINCGGTYYLPIPLYASESLIKLAYPKITEFLAKKLEYDPEEIFINSFYQKYKKE